MPIKANAERISWFLGLDRMLAAPRRSMAPSRDHAKKDRQNTQSLIPSQLDWLKSSVSPIRTEYANSTLLSPIQLQAIRSPRRSSLNVTTSSASKAGRLMMSNSFRIQTVPQVSKSAMSEGHNKNQALVPRISIAKLPAVARFDRLTQTRTPQSKLPTDIGPRSKQTKPIAPFLVGSREQPSTPFENRYSDPQSPARRYNDSCLSPKSGVQNAPRSLESGRALQSQSLSPNGTDITDRNQFAQNNPSISTIHIDGSALGRWTIQHLERALGRPTTGMTGVDPRAAIPRSRVAPY